MMVKFNSQEELGTFARIHIVTSNDRALLIDPVRYVIEGEFEEGLPKLAPETISEVPADQVQHYLEKGFRWPEAPAPPEPLPDAEQPKIKLPFECSCGQAYRYEWSLKGHRTRTGHA